VYQSVRVTTVLGGDCKNSVRGVSFGVSRPGMLAQGHTQQEIAIELNMRPEMLRWRLHCYRGRAAAQAAQRLSLLLLFMYKIYRNLVVRAKKLVSIVYSLGHFNNPLRRRVCLGIKEANCNHVVAVR